jgi:predicted molibdopterin-dependent oxidoreductase YjgC
MMTKTVTLTINGKSVTVPASYTVLEAARQLNINIPTLCYCAHLGSGVSNKPASCRVCVVEIEKRRYRIVKIGRKLSDSTGGSKLTQKLAAGAVLAEKAEQAQDLSMIYLEEELSTARKKEGVEPDRLEMQIRKPVYSSDRRPIFEDVGNPEGERQEIVVKVHAVIYILIAGS